MNLQLSYSLIIWELPSTVSYQLHSEQVKLKIEVHGLIGIGKLDHSRNKRAVPKLSNDLKEHHDQPVTFSTLDQHYVNTNIVKCAVNVHKFIML